MSLGAWSDGGGGFTARAGSAVGHSNQTDLQADRRLCIGQGEGKKHLSSCRSPLCWRALRHEGDGDIFNASELSQQQCPYDRI